MAVSDLGEELTAAHQRAQRALTGNALKRLSAAWAAVDPADEVSWLRYVAEAEELCRSARTRSGQVAFRYLERFRKAELHALGMIADGLTVARPGVAVAGELESLIAGHGPAFVRRLVANGVSLEEAKRLALSGQFGSITGHILGSGRSVISAGISGDRKCIGYRRVCSGAACSFCAMLATRGAVYKENSFRGRGAGGVSLASRGKASPKGAQVHRACQCHMEPVYSRNSRPNATALRYEGLWREAKGNPLEFRRLVEGRA